MAEIKTAGAMGISLEDLQKTLRRLQKEGERLLTQFRTDAVDLFNKDRRQAVEDLVSQAKQLGTDVQNGTERALKGLEGRSQRVFKIIEKRAGQTVEPIIRGLNLTTRDEIEKLRKRISLLEKRLDALSERQVQAA